MTIRVDIFQTSYVEICTQPLFTYTAVTSLVFALPKLRQNFLTYQWICQWHNKRWTSSPTTFLAADAAAWSASGAILPLAMVIQHVVMCVYNHLEAVYDSGSTFISCWVSELFVTEDRACARWLRGLWKWCRCARTECARAFHFVGKAHAYNRLDVIFFSFV